MYSICVYPVPKTPVRGCGGFGGRQEFAFLAKIMQFFMQMMALMTLQNQACGESCGCGGGLDCLG